MKRITTFERYLAPTGRVLVGVFFITAGFGKIVDISGTTAFISSVGFPMAGVLALLAIVIEIGGGFMLLTGFKGRCAALLLALFVIIITFPFHGPSLWADNPMQQIMFMKNVAIVGALLFMAAQIVRVADFVDTENSDQVLPKPTL